VNYENTNNFKILFSQQVPTQTILWMVIFKLCYGSIKHFETSSYGSLNSGAQQAFLAYNALLLTLRVLIQITPFITQTYQEEETITKKTRLLLRAIMENFL
jgi:hypothetical protein